MSLLLAAPLGVLAACTAKASTEPQLTSPTLSAQTTGLSVPASAVRAEFGPTGTHWPTRTPRPSDRFDVTIECECTWQDIARAIQSATQRTPQGKALVLVKPGVLPGGGAGSSKPPVLQGIGATGRPYRVLVMPRDGIGSITHTASIRIEAVKGVSFVGFWLFPESLVLTSVQDVAWAWSKGQAFNISTGSAASRNVELVECVTADSKLTETDTWAFRTGGNPLENVAVVGCYLAPSYKPAGSSAHCDTLQLSGDQPQATVVMKDSVIFASTNAAFIPSGVASGVLFDHSLVVGGDRMLQRYPAPSGANAFTSGLPSAVNGSGTKGILSARNSTFIGAVRGEWASVQSSKTSGSATPASSGAFTIDPSLSSVDGAWLDRQAPRPTDERLRAMWMP